MAPGLGTAALPTQVVTNARNFRTTFDSEALFGNPQFVPDGGTLGFGLQHYIRRGRARARVRARLRSTKEERRSKCTGMSARLGSSWRLLDLYYKSRRMGSDSEAGSSIG
jgi:hypothetical protein